VQLTDPRFYQFGEMDGAAIYRNDADTGRAYLVAPGPDGAPPSIDGLQRVDASVQEIERSPERQTFAFTAPADGYLTIGSPAYPGWTATLDGRPAPVRTIEGVLPAVRVTPGLHRLTYAYEPRSLRLGAALSLLGLAAGLGWPAGCWLWRRRRATGPRAGTTA
jgi:hypothetical protein